MLNVGPLELLVVLAVALIVVGPERLPELARSVGRVLRQFRDVQNEVRSMVSSEVNDDMRDAANEFRKVTGGIKQATDVKGAVRRTKQTIRDETTTPPRKPRATPAAGEVEEAGGAPADRLVEDAATDRPPTGGDTEPETPLSPMRTLPRWRRKSPEEREGAMSLMDHLKELRHRLVICLWALLAGSVGGFFLYEPAMRLIKSPYCDFLRDNPDKAPFEQEGCSLIFLGAIDGFMITVKVIVFLALIVALPVILYQLWAFIVPGLTSRERKWAIPFVALSLVLFLLGGLAAYLTLPKALDFLLGVGGDFVSPLLTVDKYIGFVIFTILAFGLGFEFPILLISLTAAGVLTNETMRKYRRQVILGLAIFSAVITPSPDPVSMLALLIPLYVFYEGAIIVSRVLKR